MSWFLVLAGGRGAELREPLPVERRHVVARVQQLIEPLDLRDPDRRLQVGEPVVEADAVVLHLVGCPAHGPGCARSDTRSATSLSGVTRTPPSPVVICLLA